MGIRSAATAFATVIALALPATPTSAAPPFSDQAAAKIDRAAEKQIASGKTVGLAIQVVQDGKVVYSRGYGTANLEWKTPVTPDTVFRIASNTKSFTAASVLILAEQGRLSLDDKVSKFLPGFPGGDRVTIRQLLTHTSGLATYDETYRDGPELAVQKSTEQMITLIKGLKPLYDFEPGAAYKYSNSGYYLLGAIVETVSGASLNAFMTDTILKRAGLEHTAMDAIEDIVPLRAAGYNRVPGKPGAFSNTTYIPYTTPGPAGGLRSTVGDLTRWYEALFTGKVVRPDLVDQMITPARVNDGRLTSLARWSPPGPPTPYEYGFGVRMSSFQGRREIWHSGAVDGFTSQIRTYPDDRITISLLANTFRALDGVLEEVQLAALGLSPSAPAK